MGIQAEPKKKKAKRKRSAGSKKKQDAKNSKKYARKIRAARAHAYKEHLALDWLNKRTPAFPYNVEKWLSVGTHSSEVPVFYREHYLRHSQLEVRFTGPNFSNPKGKEGGGAGVFARKDIPAGTVLCPYVALKQGKRCEEMHRGASFVHRCGYCMLVDKSTGLYFCARQIKYDLLYLSVPEGESAHGVAEIMAERYSSPPNYARYVNTLTPIQLETDSFNCIFEADREGVDVVWLVSSVDIKQGSELSVDYGDKFGTIDELSN